MNFTDMQVLTLVRNHPGLNLYQLTKKANEEMGRWNWSIGKVWRAVNRLKKAGKVETRIKQIGGKSCLEVHCKTV